MPNKNYFEWLRNDVLEVVPVGTRTVLSVGCASGRTEAELVKKGMDVYGIELDSSSVEIARSRGINVIEGDAENVHPAQFEVEFDFMIFADVLEHLKHPEGVLGKYFNLLKPGGGVYICVPNFRHYSVFWQLFVKGKINYLDGGILDRTHLRITTRKMLEDWFKHCGLAEVQRKYIRHKRRDKWFDYISMNLLREFTAFQIGMVGRKKY